MLSGTVHPRSVFLPCRQDAEEDCQDTLLVEPALSWRPIPPVASREILISCESSSMNARDLTIFETVLMRGPWITLGVALFLSPVAYWLIAIFMERRRPRWHTEFLALAIGDPALAAFLAIAAYAFDGHSLQSVATSTLAMIAVCSAWLIFGVFQLTIERKCHFFSRSQRRSPTKLWHQFIIYPLLGGLIWTALINLIASPGDIGLKVLAAGALAVWFVCMVIDRGRPVLGHAPFDWRRIRPLPQPWIEESVTLDSWRRWKSAA